MTLSQDHRQLLLTTAKQSIATGLQQHQPLSVDLANVPGPLQAEGCCFVTLHLDGKLRGCIGSLQAYQPLIIDVAQHAYAAAFTDPRFPPVSNSEVPRLSVEISVLSPQQAVSCRDEDDLIRQLQPGVDGLTLRDGRYHSTFLPSVWEQLPNPRDFLLHLKRKAGMPDNYWSPSLQVFRYTTETFGDT